MKKLIAKLEVWLRSLVGAEVRRVETSLAAERVLLKTLMAAAVHEMEKEVARIVAEKAALLTAEHEEVLRVKADLMGAVKELDAKLVAMHNTAIEGILDNGEKVVAAAKEVNVARRRVCSFCHRVVVSFETDAHGLIKCI